MSGETNGAAVDPAANVELSWEATMSVFYVDLLVNQIQAMGAQLKAAGAPHCAPVFAQVVTHLQKLRARIIEVERTGLVIAQPGDVPKATPTGGVR